MENISEKVEIEQKSEKPGPEPVPEEFVRVPQICVEDWQEAMFIQNTDLHCFVSSQYIAKFYTNFVAELQKRYEQFNSCCAELAEEIKAYVANAFEERSFQSIENIFGLRLVSVFDKDVKFDCVEPDYSLFFAMDCIAQWTLAYGTTDDIDKRDFALKICSELMERPRRFWPILAARIFEQSLSSVPMVLQHELPLEEKLWSLKVAEFYSRVMCQQKRSSHPNDIMLAGCWIRNAQAELSQAAGTLTDDMFFLNIISIFLVTCMPLIADNSSDWTKSLSDLKVTLTELDSTHWQVCNLLETIQDIEKDILAKNTQSIKMDEH